MLSKQADNNIKNKYPQLSKPEATVAGTQTLSGDRMKIKNKIQAQLWGQFSSGQQTNSV